MIVPSKNVTRLSPLHFPGSKFQMLWMGGAATRHGDRSMEIRLVVRSAFRLARDVHAMNVNSGRSPS